MPLEKSLSKFLSKSALVVPGLRTKMQDFVDAFSRANAPDRWTRQEIVAAINDLIATDPLWTEVCRGRAGDNYDSLGNVMLPHHRYEKFDKNILKVII